MKKQFITGVLLLAVTAFGFSTFTSCKDTDEDLYNELQSEQVSLKATIKALQDQLAQCPQNCQQKIETLKQDLMKLINEKANSAAVSKEIDDSIKALLLELQKTYVEQATYNTEIHGEGGIIERLTALENEFSDTDVADLKELIAIKSQLQALFGENGTIAGLQKSIKDLDEILNGKDGEPGLVKTVEDLSAWFDGIGIDAATFQDYVKQGEFVKTNKLALEGLVGLFNDGTINADALKELNKYYNNFEGINNMYTAIFEDAELPEGAEDWWNYGEVMQNIMKNSADILALQKDVEKLLNRLNDMVTSLVLQASHNSVFNSVNTPFGINSMVLMTVYGELATQVREFPVSGKGAECYNNEYINWEDMIPDSEFYRFEDRDTKMIVALDEAKEAKLGNLWFTVNPATVNNLDLKEFSIVNSVENEIVKVKVSKDDETVLKFGVSSRAAGNGNGLYKADVTVAPDDLDKIKVHIESGLVESLKNAVKNHTASDMVTMLKTVYNQLQDICDANALRYTGKYADKDENGNWIETQQKVYSNYGIAATAFKPLSYATLKGSSIGGHLPTISPIEIDKSLVDLKLGKFTVGNVSLDVELDLGKIVINNVGSTIIYVKVPTHFDNQGNADDWKDEPVEIGGKLDEVIGTIRNSINEWFDGNGQPGSSLNEKLQAQIEAAVDKAFNGSDGLIANIEGQVNDMMGSIQGKLNDLVDKINSEYLGKVNSLIGKYNTVAERINRALKDPNHYLQSVMLYRKAGKLALNGHTPEVELPFGILSTNPEQPTQFKGAGEAISLWATSYTFETVAPAFKKFVGVVSVKDQDGNLRKDLADEANATLAKVMPGDKTRVALDVKNAKGGTFTYEIAFQALDYTGHTSTVKCYLQVVR